MLTLDCGASKAQSKGKLGKCAAKRKRGADFMVKAPALSAKVFNHSPTILPARFSKSVYLFGSTAGAAHKTYPKG